MIRLNRLNGDPVWLNPDQIEHMEQTPDTVITLTNGHLILVEEKPEEVVKRVIAFRRAIHPCTEDGQE